jgi:GT2 family glycosyltransferase
VLDGLARQEKPPAFEVIVSVDGAGTPDFDGAELHPQCARLVLVRLGTPQGVSVARNRAVERADGEILGFLDDDTVPEPDWLNRLASCLPDQSAAVAGRIIEKHDHTALGQLRELAFRQRHVHNFTRIATGHGGVDSVNGGNCGFRTAVFRELGGFDPSFRKSQDRDLARRAVLAGHRVSYAQDLVVTHAATYTVKGFLRGRYRAGRAARVMQRLSGSTSVGPVRTKTTYGDGPITLAQRHGLRLGIAALASLAAHHAGWITGSLFGAEGKNNRPPLGDPPQPTEREIHLPTRA